MFEAKSIIDRLGFAVRQRQKFVGIRVKVVARVGFRSGGEKDDRKFWKEARMKSACWFMCHSQS